MHLKNLLPEAFVAPLTGILLLVQTAQAQVINFDVPGGAGAHNFVGQGADSDPGHNFWNPVVGNGTTGATNRLSDGITASPITLTSQMGGTYGTQGTTGTPAGLLSPYAYNNGITRTNTLNNVPAGTYNLYLYGINNTGTRGTTFTVSTAVMGSVTLSTSNTPASLTTFSQGADYVVFSNVVVAINGMIVFTWTANPDVTVVNNNEGDFSALQLVFVSTNTVVTNPPPPNFGAGVLIFDPSMSSDYIQSQLDNVFASQQYSEMGPGRYAYFFKPGHYTNLDVNVGYYTQVIGLGQNPDDVLITGNIHSDGVGSDHNATVNFWRAVENLAVVPTSTTYSPLEANNTMTWAVSQDTSLRRMHIEGNINLANTNATAWSSGGFLADSKVDATVSSRTQQQWLSRNDLWSSWNGQNWNMVFVGVSNPPAGAWPGSKFTVITNTPLVREKPYLTLDSNSNYVVMVPSLETNSLGTTWSAGPTPGVSIPISRFYFVQPGLDNSGTINAALNAGMNLIFTPGIYNLTNTINVTQPDTLILGLGYPTLIPTNGNVTLQIADVDGVKVAGLILDAGPTASPSLLQVGAATSALRHPTDPVCLFDLCCRVGGEFVGTTTNCVTIYANDVIGDNLWLWRADHGAGSSPAWTGNPSASGLVVNGDYVTMYGLFCEHHEQFQTVWNGNWGRVYFYQSELPYDAPSQAAWSHNGINGYASYKVADSVTSHQAYGLGVYGVFINSTTTCYDVIETPANSQQVNLHDIIMVYITGESGSQMTHIINGTGPSLSTGVSTATANQLWPNPAFQINMRAFFTNVSITLPTESVHSYQLQYKRGLTDNSWLSLGRAFGGNDAQETVSAAYLSDSNLFYRVRSF